MPMLREFTTQLRKTGDHKGAWTCVKMDDSVEFFGTTHMLPVKSSIRKAIGKDVGDPVHVRIEERIG